VRLLNSYDRRFEPEEVTVRIHHKAIDFLRSFVASFEPLNQGVRVTFSEQGRMLAEKASIQHKKNAAENHRKLKYGFSKDGSVVGCYGELAIVALTGVEDWTTVPNDLGNGKCKAADVGKTLQVRATTHSHGKLRIYPDDVDAPFILAIVSPPSPVVDVIGWMNSLEARSHKEWLTDFGHADQPKCWGVPQAALRDLCDLPEDNFAWLRSLPTGYLKQIQEKEQYEKEHEGEFKF
jgi:hypothetical protein